MNKFVNKEFKDMSNEELCAIAARLKFQLVEARFKMSSGELEKVNVVKAIRKTIAKIFTELTNRGYKVSIGVHGVTMYDIKTNKPMPLDPKKLQELMKKDQKKDTKKAPAKVEAKPAKAEEKPAKAETTKKEAPKAKVVKKPAAKVAKKGDK